MNRLIGFLIVASIVVACQAHAADDQEPGARLQTAPVKGIPEPDSSAAVVAGDQATTSRFYLELLGNGGLYSFNYEQRINGTLAVRIGLAEWSAGDLFGGGETEVLSVPLMLNALWGSRGHYLETGAGVLLGRIREDNAFTGESRKSNFRSVTATVGYRYQRQPHGFLFRVGFTPFYGFGEEADAYPDKGFIPSIGVSFGFGV